jgi:hypothetical protein
MVVQMHYSKIKTEQPLPERFERKFYLSPNKVDLANGLLRHLCMPDREFPSEQINSLYFDTVDLDQHEKSTSGDSRKDKVRIRWYGREAGLRGPQTIFVELKSKEAFASTKQRLQLQVPAEDLSLESLRRGIIPRIMLHETLAGFGYFPPGQLLPVIKISYWRNRFTEMISGQRVSLDFHIRSTMVMPEAGNGERELELEGGVIEIKGLTMELPLTLMKLRMLDIDWSRFSKYSACIDAHCEGLGVVGRMSPSGRVIRC